MSELMEYRTPEYDNAKVLIINDIVLYIYYF